MITGKKNEPDDTIILYFMTPGTFAFRLRNIIRLLAGLHVVSSGRRPRRGNVGVAGVEISLAGTEQNVSTAFHMEMNHLPCWILAYVEISVVV